MLRPITLAVVSADISSTVSAFACAEPSAATWPDGTRSQVDQVCLDVPPTAYDVEVAFWQGLTGWDLTEVNEREFERLQPPDEQPLRWLVQRLDDDGGPVRAHLDLSASDLCPGEPLLAARYEAIAVALGYQPAQGLDNVRK